MIQPPYLQVDDCVAIVAPAGKISFQLVDNAAALLQQWGFRIKTGAHAAGEFEGFSGTDDERRADLQWAIDDPDIKAVFCARGGYGCGRIIDLVDFSAMQLAPKWIIGFSDITIIHARLQQVGIASIHGAMPKNFPANATNNESTQTLRQALFGELFEYAIPPHPFNRTGQAHGVLTGGNLSLVANIAATADDLCTGGAILFLEEVGEALYHIDRMMTNLQRSGKLDKLAGIIIGHFSETNALDYFFGKTAYEIIADYTNRLHIPVCYGFPAGHEEPNYALYFGRKIKLDVRTANCTINYSA